MTAGEELPPVDVRLPGPRGLTRLVSIAGVVLTASSIWPEVRSSAPWVLGVAIASLIAWAALSLLPARAPLWSRVGLLAVMVVAGAIAASLSTGVASVVLLVGVVMVLGATTTPLSTGIAITAVALAAVGAAALLAPQPSQLVAAGCAAGGILIGIARRQARDATERERLTARRLVDAHRALAESAARDERTRIARDLHDVLAHTLGGLVVQLDAVEGLAEAGRLDEVVSRARAARELAADGLHDARVAVGVLDGTRSVDLSDLAAQVRRLVSAEQQLGAEVDAHVDELHGVAAPTVIDAFREVVRESLTNARKHAPGRTVRLRLTTDGRMLVLEVANAFAADAERGMLASSGSGRGLHGIRARVQELPGGEVSFSTAGEEFSLRVTARAS